MSEVLNLTQEQKDQIAAIMKEAAAAEEAQRAKMRELRKETEQKIRALLTPEQQQKFDAMPRPEFGRGPRHGGPHGPPPPDGNLPPPDAPPGAGSPPPPPNNP